MALPHVSGDASDTRPLQHISQFTDEHDETSRAAFSTDNFVIHSDGRMSSGQTWGKDPGLKHVLEQGWGVVPDPQADKIGGNIVGLCCKVEGDPIEMLRVSPEQPEGTFPHADENPPSRMLAQEREITLEVPAEIVGESTTFPEQNIDNDVYV